MNHASKRCEGCRDDCAALAVADRRRAGLLRRHADDFLRPLWKLKLDRRYQARELFGRYSYPLLRATYELQSRLYNITRLHFLEAYAGPDDRQHYAEASTLWLLGQYLGWVEILRRELQFLDAGTTARNRKLQDLLIAVADEIATDKTEDQLFRIFRANQRAIGEVMIIERSLTGGAKRTDCLGYAEFTTRLGDKEFHRWFESLSGDLAELVRVPSKHARLIRVQRALVDLVDFLDADRSRFPNRNDRGKLPLLPSSYGGAATAKIEMVSRFVFEQDEGEPWAAFDQWVQRHGLKQETDAPATRRVLGNPSVLGTRLVVDASYVSGWFEFRAAAESPRWAIKFGLAPPRVSLETRDWRFPRSRSRARKTVDDLLCRYDRPTVR